MLIQYYSDGLKIYARVYNCVGFKESCYVNYTAGWITDGSAEQGIIDLHYLLLNKLI